MPQRWEWPQASRSQWHGQSWNGYGGGNGYAGNGYHNLKLVDRKEVKGP